MSHYLWGRRVNDFAILATIPLLGFVYGTPDLTPASLFTLAELAAVSVLLLVHIFALNDWADYGDISSFSIGKAAEAGRPGIMLVSVIALGCCVVLLWSMSASALLPAGLVIVASAIYSLDWPIRGKEVLWLSSGLHAICGAAFFLMGLAVAAGLSARWSSIWIFLGLSVAAGHINQEISDYREDCASHVRTHATVFGPQTTFIIGQLIFAGAFLAFLMLPDGARSGLTVLLAAVACAANLALAIACWRRGSTPESVEWYRAYYRALYVLVGLGLLLDAPAVRDLTGH